MLLALVVSSCFQNFSKCVFCYKSSKNKLIMPFFLSSHLQTAGWQCEREGSELLNGDAQSCPCTSPLLKHHGSETNSPKALYICNKLRIFIPDVRPLWKKNITNFKCIIWKRKKSTEWFKSFTSDSFPSMTFPRASPKLHENTSSVTLKSSHVLKIIYHAANFSRLQRWCLRLFIIMK